MGCGASKENALVENTNSSAGEKEIAKVANQVTCSVQLTIQ